MKSFASVADYIAAQPKPIQARLRQMRAMIKQAAPGAEEQMAYGMPAYKLAGRALVYFAGFAKHVGFYGTPAANEGFAKQLASYKQGRGSIQFPHDRPLPLALVTRIVKYRAKQNLERVAKPAKAANKPAKRARSRR